MSNNNSNNSNNNDNKNSNNKIEPKFNEYLAYEELRLIIARALEYGDFAMLEANISAWEKKYPLDSFINPEIIRKIKEILNKDYLTRIFGDFWARKLLHEHEALQKAYLDLKSLINTANKNGDYKTALKEIKKWKENLHNQGLSVTSFDKSLKSKVCYCLLLPSKKIKNQQEAASALRVLVDSSNEMDKKTLSEEISNWQNKFSTKIFDKKFQKEVNDTTASLLDTAQTKGFEEEALKKINESLHSDITHEPYLLVSEILSKYDITQFSEDTKLKIYDLSSQAMFTQEYNRKLNEKVVILPEPSKVTSKEFEALNSLKNILSHNSSNMDAIISWIYETRKISFSKYSREEIIRYFANEGYKIPKQASYVIPEASLDLSDFSRIKRLQKNTIINYLGILSIGNSISSMGKENLERIHSSTKLPNTSLIEKSISPSIVITAYDNLSTGNKELGLKNGERKNDIEIVLENIYESSSYSIDLRPKLNQQAIQRDSLDKEVNNNIPKTPTTSEVTINYQISSQDDELDKKADNTKTSEVSTTSEVITNYEIPSQDDELDIKADNTKTSEVSTASPYALTIEDQSNLEDINYISSFYPIMLMALSSKEKIKDDNNQEKNNGY